MRWLQGNCAGVLLCCGTLLFGLGVGQVRKMPYPQVAPEIQVVLPAFIQVGLAAGDRYLAANGGAIRSLVTVTSRMGPDEYALLAALQTEVSWLNPAHEDNYYTAAAILPWSGQLDAAQTILRRASLARPYDYQPSFLYAFHHLYFKHEPEAASAWLRQTAVHLRDDYERMVMQNLAARWVDRGRDVDHAIEVVAAMAKQARRQDFRKYLETRVERLQTVKMLRAQADVFEARYGRRPHSLQEMQARGLPRQIPADPFGFGYELNKDGLIVLRERAPS